VASGAIGASARVPDQGFKQAPLSGGQPDVGGTVPGGGADGGSRDDTPRGEVDKHVAVGDQTRVLGLVGHGRPIMPTRPPVSSRGAPRRWCRPRCRSPGLAARRSQGTAPAPGKACRPAWPHRPDVAPGRTCPRGRTARGRDPGTRRPPASRVAASIRATVSGRARRPGRKRRRPRPRSRRGQAARGGSSGRPPPGRPSRRCPGRWSRGDETRRRCRAR
jgi:hypothetical protein